MITNKPNWADSLDSPRNLSLLRLLSWTVSVSAGFLQAWATRFQLTSDGNCYLDIASAYLRGDWHNAINAYWSPFFSWLLALALLIFHPGPYWESTLLHLLNFLAFLLSLLAFEFFFRTLLRVHTVRKETEDRVLSKFALWALGYGLFLSTALFVLSASISMPDIWVAAFTYVVAAVVLRIKAEDGGWTNFAVLGSLLGCAYLMKSFYFPLSLIFLMTAWLATGSPKKKTKQALLGFTVFALVAGPWIGVLSRSRGRFTFGDVGKLALIINFAPLSQPFVWQGESGTGVPKHPVRQLLQEPKIFEFSTPVGGTYPPAYDGSYWMDGAKMHFTLRGLVLVLRQSTGTMFQILMVQAEFLTGILILFYLLGFRADWITSFRESWFLWVPPLFACLGYCSVLVEGRYVAPFLLILWVASFSSLAKPSERAPSFVLACLFLAMPTVTVLRIMKFAVSDAIAVRQNSQNTDFEVAEALHRLGVLPGDKVAGLSRIAEAHWARLAGVKIIAEIPLGNESLFWTSTPNSRQRVLDVVAGTGAKAIVTKDSPLSAISAGWTPLGQTGYYTFLLPTSSKPRTAP